MVHHPDTEDVVMTLAEQLRREGRVEGRVEGRKQGRKEGRREGRGEGIALGVRQGSRQEAADALLRVLVLRFSDVPEWARARIADAELETLRGWHDNAIVRPRLDDVFRG